MVFSARKRGNPFAARSRQRRAQSAPAAEQPKKAPAPEPEELPVELDESSGEQPLPDADDTERTAAATRFARDSDAKHADETPDVATIDISDEKPLGALIEVAARAREKLAAATDVPVDAITTLEDHEKHEEQQATKPTKRKRGRPRPQETIDRDNAVHALLVDAGEHGIAKGDLAIALAEKEQQVYSSLRQLSREGRAETGYVKDVGYRWFAKAE